MVEEIVADTENGKVRGKEQKDYHGGTFFSFSGIPYAKAPVGELRFKAPQPSEPWEGIKDGTKEGYECPSLDMFFGYHVGHEDNCLNLNIYTKENVPRYNWGLYLRTPLHVPRDRTNKWIHKANDEKKTLPNGETFKGKPVMVFIHGGGFMYGSNKSAVTGPHYLMTEEIVFVTINYRLGVFGFLSLEDQTLNVPGNAGLKDQTLALKWIQKNIHHFGGNPNNVTIFGESAGSASVHYLTLSPLTKGLFHKAIMQSGCAFNPWARGRKNFNDIARAMGYKDVDEKTLFQKLCRANARSLVNAQFKIEDTFFARDVRPLAPVVEYPHEGAFLTEEPEEIMKAGKNHQIPIIIGYNSGEGLLYEIIRKTRAGADLPDNLERDIPFDMNIPEKSEKSKEVAEKIKQFYYKNDDISEKHINTRYLLVGDVQFVDGIQKTISLLKKHSSAPVFVYRMSITSSLNFFKKFCEVKYFKTMIFFTLMTKLSGGSSLRNVFQNLREKLPVKEINGVSHADDLFYLFSTFFTPTIIRGSEEDKNIQKFVQPWTNFAKSGNPTPKQLEVLNKIVWDPIQDESISNFFDIGNTISITGNLESERVKFWDNLRREYVV